MDLALPLLKRHAWDAGRAVYLRNGTNLDYLNLYLILWQKIIIQNKCFIFPELSGCRRSHWPISATFIHMQNFWSILRPLFYLVKIPKYPAIFYIFLGILSIWPIFAWKSNHFCQFFNKKLDFYIKIWYNKRKMPFL